MARSTAAHGVVPRAAVGLYMSSPERARLSAKHFAALACDALASQGCQGEHVASDVAKWTYIVYTQTAVGSPQSLAQEYSMSQEFDVVIERDEEGYYVASVPALPACYTQARSLDELVSRIQEAIALRLEAEGSPAVPAPTLEFVGVQRVRVPA